MPKKKLSLYEWEERRLEPEEDESEESEYDYEPPEDYCIDEEGNRCPD